MTHETPLIQMPRLSNALTQLWHLLFELSQAQPDSWCLVGGLMVMLHGLEHGRSDVRPTADGDVLVDIRTRPGALRQIIGFLAEQGLEPELAPEGIQHRFKRGTDDGELQVDVLAPDHVGVRANLTTTPPGRTVEVPGGTRALQRSRGQMGHRLGSRSRLTGVTALSARRRDALDARFTDNVTAACQDQTIRPASCDQRAANEVQRNSGQSRCAARLAFGRVVFCYLHVASECPRRLTRAVNFLDFAP